MSAPRKFDEETRARAVRLFTDRLRDHGESKLTARKHVGALLDIKPATLRNWIEAEQRAARPASLDTTNSVGVRDPPGLEVRDDLFDHVTDLVDLRVERLLPVQQVPVSGFPEGSERARTDVGQIDFTTYE